MKNETISLRFHYHKQFKNGKHLYKYVEFDYIISTEIASKEEFKKRLRSQEIQTILYESTRALINAHNQETKHDVCYIVDEAEIKDPLAITSFIEKDIHKFHQMQLLKKALKTLTKKQQRRFYLYFIAGYNYREIAKLEGISTQVARNSIQKTLQKIKAICKASDQ